MSQSKEEKEHIKIKSARLRTNCTIMCTGSRHDLCETDFNSKEKYIAYSKSYTCRVYKKNVPYTQTDFISFVFGDFLEVHVVCHAKHLAFMLLLVPMLVMCFLFE